MKRCFGSPNREWLHPDRFRNEPIYCEAPHNPDDVLYSGSDDEAYHSPTERRIRCETQAQRFLEGKPVFLLSASLRGPFDKKSGWVNPWRSKSASRTKSTQRRRPPAAKRVVEEHNEPSHIVDSSSFQLPTPERTITPPRYMDDETFVRVRNWRDEVLVEAHLPTSPIRRPSQTEPASADSRLATQHTARRHSAIALSPWNDAGSSSSLSDAPSTSKLQYEKAPVSSHNETGKVVPSSQATARQNRPDTSALQATDLDTWNTPDLSPQAVRIYEQFALSGRASSVPSASQVTTGEALAERLPEIAPSTKGAADKKSNNAAATPAPMLPEASSSALLKTNVSARTDGSFRYRRRDIRGKGPSLLRSKLPGSLFVGKDAKDGQSPGDRATPKAPLVSREAPEPSLERRSSEALMDNTPEPARETVWEAPEPRLERRSSEALVDGTPEAAREIVNVSAEAEREGTPADASQLGPYQSVQSLDNQADESQYGVEDTAETPSQIDGPTLVPSGASFLSENSSMPSFGHFSSEKLSQDVTESIGFPRRLLWPKSHRNSNRASLPAPDLRIEHTPRTVQERPAGLGLFRSLPLENSGPAEEPVPIQTLPEEQQVTAEAGHLTIDNPVDEKLAETRTEEATESETGSETGSEGQEDDAQITEQLQPEVRPEVDARVDAENEDEETQIAEQLQAEVRPEVRSEADTQVDVEGKEEDSQITEQLQAEVRAEADAQDNAEGGEGDAPIKEQLQAEVRTEAGTPVDAEAEMQTPTSIPEPEIQSPWVKDAPTLFPPNVADLKHPGCNENADTAGAKSSPHSGVIQSPWKKEDTVAVTPSLPRQPPFSHLANPQLSLITNQAVGSPAAQSPWAKGDSQIPFPEPRLFNPLSSPANSGVLPAVADATPRLEQAPCDEDTDMCNSQLYPLPPSTPETKRSGLPTPDFSLSIKSFKDFMTPSPQPASKRRRISTGTDGHLPSTQALVDAAISNPWAKNLSGKSTKTIKPRKRHPKRVSWAPLPGEEEEQQPSTPTPAFHLNTTAAAPTTDSPYGAELPFSQPLSIFKQSQPQPPQPHRRSSRVASPPPSILVAAALPATNERFGKHFAAVLATTSRHHGIVGGGIRKKNIQLLPSASQQVCGSPAFEAMAEAFLRADGAAALRQEKQGEDVTMADQSGRMEPGMGLEMEIDVEDRDDDEELGERMEEDGEEMEVSQVVDDVSAVLHNLDDFLGSWDLDADLAKVEAERERESRRQDCEFGGGGMSGLMDVGVWD